MQSQCSKAYILFTTDSHFYLASQKPIYKQPNYLKINRQTAKISVIARQKFHQQVDSAQRKSREELSLVLGVIIVNKQPYLAVVKTVQSVAILNNQKVFCIKNTQFIPFKQKHLYLSINQSQNQKILQGLRQDIIKQKFYFCYHFDLTLTYHKHLQKRPTQKKYFWNENMLQMFMHRGLDQCWRVPVIQGYVHQLYCQNNYFSFYYCVVNRRSKYMSGTRYNSCGINTNTHCANFVQTQQIFICHNYLFSHVSIRASTPIFWEQNQSGNITFIASEQENARAMEKHYEFITRQYQGNIVTVSLLSKKSTAQKELKSRFQFYFYKCMPNDTYIQFELGEEMKDETIKAVKDFVSKNREALCPGQNFLCIDRFSNKLYQQQSVYYLITRISCLDCVDRTSVLMSRISQIFLQQVQHYVNTHSHLKEKQLNFGKRYKSQVLDEWVKINNRISMIYYGAQSNAANIIKQEQSSLFSFFSNGFKSASRALNSKDSQRQECIQYLLGQKQQLSKTNYFEDSVSKVLDEPSYCTYQEMVIYILTWNCNTADPTKIPQKDWNKLFDFPIEKTDMVVVCLQQMVQLSSYNVLLGDNMTLVDIWRKSIQKVLNSMAVQFNKNFVFLTSKDMVGVASFVFISGQLYNRVYKQEWKEVKTGFKNNLGNKGSVILFMQIDSTMLTFANCHLAAGQKASSERLDDIRYIHNDAINDRQHRRHIDKSQFRFFIGDMNFRLQAKNQDVRQILYTIQKEDSQRKLSKNQIQTYLRALLQKDQFNLNKNTGILSVYHQASIYFLPTYKYIKRQKNYDTKRTPSWCDRILFNAINQKKLAVLKYWDVDVYQSDHKPVCGAFKILLKQQDRDMKKKLIQQYMQQPQ